MLIRRRSGTPAHDTGRSAGPGGGAVAAPDPWVPRAGGARRDALAERREAGLGPRAAAPDPLAGLRAYAVGPTPEPGPAGRPHGVSAPRGAASGACATRRPDAVSPASGPAPGPLVARRPDAAGAPMALPSPAPSSARPASAHASAGPARLGRYARADRDGSPSTPETPPESLPLSGRGRRHARALSLTLAVALCGGVTGAGVALWAAPDTGATAAAAPAHDGNRAPSGPPAASAAEAAAAEILPSVVQVRTSSGSGSGFVLDNQGHVMTNHHVIERGSSVRLVLPDGRSVSAEVVGSDAAHDIAVLRADDRDALLPAALGSSEDLTIGQGVLAVGSPLGLSGTVTGGLVSAVDRQTRLGGAGSQNVIQTDAPINPGSSGGPLVNMAGEVVGVNTAIATLSRGSGSIGIGFAVPIDRALGVADRILGRG